MAADSAAKRRCGIRMRDPPKKNRGMKPRAGVWPNLVPRETTPNPCAGKRLGRFCCASPTRTNRFACETARSGAKPLARRLVSLLAFGGEARLADSGRVERAVSSMPNYHSSPSLMCDFLSTDVLDPDGIVPLQAIAAFHGPRPRKRVVDRLDAILERVSSMRVRHHRARAVFAGSLGASACTDDARGGSACFRFAVGPTI